MKSQIEERFKPEFVQAVFSQLLKLHTNCGDLSSIWIVIQTADACILAMTCEGFCPCMQLKTLLSLLRKTFSITKNFGLMLPRREKHENESNGTEHEKLKSFSRSCFSCSKTTCMSKFWVVFSLPYSFVAFITLVSFLFDVLCLPLSASVSDQRLMLIGLWLHCHFSRTIK